MEITGIVFKTILTFKTNIRFKITGKITKFTGSLGEKRVSTNDISKDYVNWFDYITNNVSMWANEVFDVLACP